MNKALCATVGQGAFPSPAMLIQAGVHRLQSQCGLGYRAKTVMRLAEQVLLFLADSVPATVVLLAEIKLICSAMYMHMSANNHASQICCLFMWSISSNV